MSYSEKLSRLFRDLLNVFRDYEANKRKENNAKWSQQGLTKLAYLKIYGQNLQFFW